MPVNAGPPKPCRIAGVVMRANELGYSLRTLFTDAGLAYEASRSGRFLTTSFDTLTVRDVEDLLSLLDMREDSTWRRTIVQEATTFLRSALADGPVSAATLRDECETDDEDAPDWQALRIAKKRLGILSRESDTTHGEEWLLPDRSENA